jgi:predicted amidophosphoribosyltransferase
MTEKVKYMRFGVTSLARAHCKECKEETLHRKYHCIHCGTKFVPEVASSRDTWRNPFAANPEKGIKR